jgi:hypothetical protein
VEQPNLLRRSAAEMLGTFALVTAGCGAIIVNDLTDALGHVGVALAFGLVVLVMVAAGHSGDRPPRDHRGSRTLLASSFGCLQTCDHCVDGG